MATHDLIRDAVAGSSLLCLKCRTTGHVVDQCPSNRWASEFGWFFSPARMAMNFSSKNDAIQQALCGRCQDLNLLQLLHEDIPWESLSDLDQAAREGSQYIRSIGRTGSVEFRTNCPLCRCLYALTPNPSSSIQDVLILPHWTMGRLTGENGSLMDTEEKRQCAKCLLVALEPSSVHLSVSNRAHRGDALCIIEGDDPRQATTLGGRAISSHDFNINVIEEWLSTCFRLHGVHCSPVFTEELQSIRLVDVLNRKIIKYPGHPCDYVALSYVWGPRAQQSFRLGSTLGTLPQTIEDAMACVCMLGKRYLWVDSLCIDQSNEAEKLDQIKRMWSIYRGAYVTIIALSGKSADVGLSRLRPDLRTQPQLSCSIDGKRLVGLMPTLTQQIWMTPWGSRAWTLQEALLSPRCIYISDHQLYFECNAMQCCESLDQRRSWGHNLSPRSSPIREGWLSWVMDQVGPGCLKNLLDSPSNRIGHWGAKVTLYSYRSMTKESDALHAFPGILQRLETMYKEGFFYGLPVADFQWALLWQSQSPPQRRQGFPTWSWAGWKGGVWPGYPLDVTKPHQFPVPLRIWKTLGSELVKIFETLGDTSGISTCFRNDPVTRAEQINIYDEPFDISQYPYAEDLAYLFIEAVIFDFIPDYSKPRYRVHQHGVHEIFDFSVQGTQCLIRVISTDREITGTHKSQTFLLLARDRKNSWVSHHLLLVHFERCIAIRGTVLELLVPEDRLDVIGEFKPRKQRVVLS